MIYIIIIVLLALLSLRYDINQKVKGERSCYLFVLLCFILLSGLRYRLGVDTTRYITAFYHKYPDLWDITWDDFSYGSDPLYMLLNSIVHSFGGKFYIVQLIHASFVNILIFKYIKKHTPYIFTAVLFYFVIYYSGYNFDILRASMSVSVCLFANDYICEKKYVKAILVFLTGVMFHFSTIFVLVISLFPFLPRMKFNRYAYMLIVGSFFLGTFVRENLSEYLTLIQLGDVFENKVYYYLQDEDSVENNYNIFGYIGALIPVLYPLFSVHYCRQNKCYYRLQKTEPFLLIGIVLSIIALYVPIVKRFVSFYSIYIILFDSFLFISVIERLKKCDLRIGIIRTMILFLPLFFMTFKKYIDMKMIQCFYPYSSIFDKTLNPERERVFLYYEGDKALPNEY